MHGDSAARCPNARSVLMGWLGFGEALPVNSTSRARQPGFPAVEHFPLRITDDFGEVGWKIPFDRKPLEEVVPHNQLERPVEKAHFDQLSFAGVQLSRRPFDDEIGE